MGREFTLIVWGAYSTVGQRVCYELITTYRDKIRWALAGCKKKPLERIRSNLALFDKKYDKLPMIVTNIRKKAEVAKMVKRTVVVLACATPYREYCDIVVECCVEQRTNYYDTTGTPQVSTPHFGRSSRRGRVLGERCHRTIP